MKKSILCISLLFASIILYAQELTKTILPPDAPFSREFGDDVSVSSSNYMAISAEFEDGGGAIYLYQKDVFIKKILGKNIGENVSSLGSAIDLTPNWLACRGTRNGNSFVALYYSPSSNYVFGDLPEVIIDAENNYSRKIDLENNTLVVKDGDELKVYKATGSNWSYHTTILPPNDKEVSDFALDYTRLAFSTKGVSQFGNTIEPGNLYVANLTPTGYNVVFDRTNDIGSTDLNHNYGYLLDMSFREIVVSNENQLEFLVPSGSSYVVHSSIPVPGYDLRSLMINNSRVLTQVIDTVFFQRQIVGIEKINNVFTVKNDINFSHNAIGYNNYPLEFDMGNNGLTLIASDNTTHPSIANSPETYGVAFYGDFDNLTNTIEDTYEPNESDNPHEIELNRDYHSFASINPNGVSNPDWYRFTSKGESFDFKVTKPVSNGGAWVLYKGSEVIWVEVIGEEEYNRTTYLEPGVYDLIFAVTRDQEFEYTFSVSGGGCSYYSQEPNETPETAPEIFRLSGQEYSGAISSYSDVDWYSFDASRNYFSSGELNIKIELRDLPADYDLYLYDENLYEITRSWNGSTSNESIVLNNINREKYYIRIVGWAGAQSQDCYTLDFDYSSTAFSSPARKSSANNSKKSNGNNSFSVYPNPTVNSSNVTIQTDVDIQTITLKIMSIDGRQISENQEVSINGNTGYFSTGDLEPGMYIIDGGSQLGTTKLIIH